MNRPIVTADRIIIAITNPRVCSIAADDVIVSGLRVGVAVAVVVGVCVGNFVGVGVDFGVGDGV